ncbi:hypothetical protein [Candidatus Electronema sp. PJ]|uniref:hypothetical protein n=1 Tax=Candidatus Electronema sp. PJ TaxID=3401572 RepID=UPI003AA91C74
MKAYQLTVEAIAKKTLIPAGEIEQILSEMAQEMNISPISMLKTVRFLGVIDGLCLNIISRYHLKQPKKEAQNSLSLPLLGPWEETHRPDSAQVVEAVQPVVLQRHRERPESPLPTPVVALAKSEERLAPALSCGARFAATLKKNRPGAEKKGKKAAFRKLPRISPVAALVTQEEQLDAALSCGARFAALLQKKSPGAERKGVEKKATHLRGLYSGKTLRLRHACMKTYPLTQDAGSVSKEFG